MNVIEVAVYALVLAGGADPFTCEKRPQGVACTNGLGAVLNEHGNIEYSNGVQVVKLKDGSLAFTNGVTTHRGAAGWIQFSSGVSVRRMSDGSFRFNNGMSCKAVDATKVDCRKAE